MNRADERAVAPLSEARTYFLWVFAWTWMLQLPAVLAKWNILPGRVESYMGLAALGALGPCVVATSLAWKAQRRAGVRALYARLGIRGFSPVWYVVALLAFVVPYALAVAVYRTLGGHSANWIYPPETSQHVVGLLLMPFNEEVGWRGYALPRMRQRQSAHTANLQLGSLWALWHLMMFFLQGETTTTFVAGMAYIAVGNITVGWLFEKTYGSLAIAVAVHMSTHLNNPFRAAPANATPMVIGLSVACLLALAAVGSNWKQWTERPASPT